MGFLRRLWGGQPDDGTAAAMGEVVFYADGHAETGDGITWADVSVSPSDTFVLLWRDATDDNSTVGYRTGGPGRYRLIEGGAGLRCDGRLDRPNDGHVANNGAFIISDWLFTDELHSRLYVFSADGKSLIRRENWANTLATYMEPAGLYAAAQLAAAPDDDRDDDRFILST